MIVYVYLFESTFQYKDFRINLVQINFCQESMTKKLLGAVLAQC